MSSEQQQLVIGCLKATNYFENEAKKALESATSLIGYCIVIEKSFNVTQVTFVYDPKRKLMVRINSYEKARSYKKNYHTCSCENPCYKDSYSITDFIDLINRKVFEPVDFINRTN